MNTNNNDENSKERNIAAICMKSADLLWPNIYLATDSMKFASLTSFSDNPPQSCVLRVICTYKKISEYL